MIKVKKGQDPYSVIGQYIRDHISAIEYMIAVIEINGKTSNELFMVDMTVDGYFIWESDWYEGEENVVLIDFFPVSDACNPKDHWIPCSERLPDKEGMHLITEQNYGFKEDAFFKNELVHTSYFSVNKKEFQDTVYMPNCSNITAWMPLPEVYKEGEQE